MCNADFPLETLFQVENNLADFLLVVECFTHNSVSGISSSNWHIGSSVLWHADYNVFRHSTGISAHLSNRDFAAQSDPGPRLNIKTVLSTYGDFHVKDKTAVRTSYL